MGKPKKRHPVPDDKFVAFLKTYQKRNGFPPSIREIMKAVGLASTSAVSYRLEKLVEQKIVRHVRKGQARAYVINTRRTIASRATA
jgi:repressor LexA